MISPPTDRLHKFLAIAGVALFTLGVTIPLDRYDQAVRQFIEAKSKVMELSQAQIRLSQWLEAVNNRVQQSQADRRPPVSSKPGSANDMGRLAKDPLELEREIADLSIQARKQIDLAEHVDKIRRVWFGLGLFCIIGGLIRSTLGFAMWWRQPASER
jgi:hypothetical protein